MFCAHFVTSTFVSSVGRAWDCSAKVCFNIPRSPVQSRHGGFHLFDFLVKCLSFTTHSLCTYLTLSQRVHHCFSALFSLPTYFVALTKWYLNRSGQIHSGVSLLWLNTLMTFSHELAQARTYTVALHLWRHVYIMKTSLALSHVHPMFTPDSSSL